MSQTSQTPQEMTKDIIIAAIESGSLIKAGVQNQGSIEAANEFNANQIAKAYKIIFQSVLKPQD